MSKNNYLLFGVFGLGIILFGTYIFVNSGSEEPNNQDVTNNVVRPDTKDEISENLIDKEEVSIPEDAVMYQIQSGNSSYSAQKRFLSKEDEVVVGVTEGVSGEAWLSEETGTLYVDATADIKLLATDKPKRDADVLKFFKVTQANMTVDMPVPEGFVVGEELETPVSGNLTVNDVTKNVTFLVKATPDEDGFVAVGETTILMSDFGIDPPSLAGVFTVDDEVVIGFDVTAVKVN